MRKIVIITTTAFIDIQNDLCSQLNLSGSVWYEKEIWKKSLVKDYYFKNVENLHLFSVGKIGEPRPWNFCGVILEDYFEEDFNLEYVEYGDEIVAFEGSVKEKIIEFLKRFSIASDAHVFEGDIDTEMLSDGDFVCEFKILKDIFRQWIEKLPLEFRTISGFKYSACVILYAIQDETTYFLVGKKDNNINMIGGKFDYTKDLTYLDCAKRELYEETFNLFDDILEQLNYSKYFWDYDRKYFDDVAQIRTYLSEIEHFDQIDINLLNEKANEDPRSEHEYFEWIKLEDFWDLVLSKKQNYNVRTNFKIEKKRIINYLQQETLKKQLT